MVGLPLGVAAGVAPTPNEESLDVRVETIDGRKLKQTLARGRGRFLVLFTASWCGYCRRLREDMLQVRLGLRTVEVDVSDEEDPAWDDWHVEIVPTAVLFRDGTEVSRRTPTIRGLSLDDLRALAAQH